MKTLTLFLILHIFFICSESFLFGSKPKEKKDVSLGKKSNTKKHEEDKSSIIVDNEADNIDIEPFSKGEGTTTQKSKGTTKQKKKKGDDGDVKEHTTKKSKDVTKGKVPTSKKPKGGTTQPTLTDPEDTDWENEEIKETVTPTSTQKSETNTTQGEDNTGTSTNCTNTQQPEVTTTENPENYTEIISIPKPPGVEGDNSVHKLTCYWCTDKCQLETEERCTENHDRCYHLEYEGGYIEKGCIMEQNWNFTFERRHEVHGGLRDTSYRCEGSLCNAKRNF